MYKIQFLKNQVRDYVIMLL